MRDAVHPFKQTNNKFNYFLVFISVSCNHVCDSESSTVRLLKVEFFITIFPFTIYFFFKHVTFNLYQGCFSSNIRKERRKFGINIKCDVTPKTGLFFLHKLHTVM